MRICFMGTPDFAVPSLEALALAGHEIVCVYTQPDKPQGRGMKEGFPPVKQKALELGIPVRQPLTLSKNEEEAQFFQSLQLDAAIVVAYGKLFPVVFLEAPRYGAINGHASLLPRWRGAAPIQWAIYHGDTETGVTAMQMSKGMDEGDILLQKTLPISSEATGASLFSELSHLSAEVLLDTLVGLEAGALTPISQAETGIKPTLAPLIKKEMATLDFSKTATELYNQVRAFQPWPGARFRFREKWVKVFETAVLAENHGASPGTILSAEELCIACSEGSLLLKEVQMEGKKRQTGEEFMRGYKPALEEISTQ